MKVLHVLGNISKRLKSRRLEHDTVVVLAASLLITLTAVIAYDVTRPLVSRPGHPEVAVGSHSSRLVVASSGQPGGMVASPPADSEKASGAAPVGPAVDNRQGSDTPLDPATNPASAASTPGGSGSAPQQVDLPAVPAITPAVRDDCTADDDGLVMGGALGTITLGLGVLGPLIGNQPPDCS